MSGKEQVFAGHKWNEEGRSDLQFFLHVWPLVAYNLLVYGFILAVAQGLVDLFFNF